MSIPAERAYALADVLLIQAQLLAPPTDVAELVGELSDPELLDLLERAGQLAADAQVCRFRKAIRSFETGDQAMLAGEYERLFSSAVTCPINEAGYIRRDKGAILGDVQGFYRAFGIAVDSDAEERGDHLICELEFLGLLLVMYGNACRNDATEHAAVSWKAARDFATDHLNDWIGSFCERLAFVTEFDGYDAIADSLRQTWRTVSEQLELPEPNQIPVPSSGELDQDSGWSCGGAAGAATAQNGTAQNGTAP